MQPCSWHYCALLLVLPQLAVAGASGAGTDPVAKVLSLLSNLEAKITKDGEAETKAYESYAEWCKDGAKDLGFEIKTAKSDIEDLTATIGKATADISASASKIEELSADTSTNEADLKAATEVRAKEEAEYESAAKELEDVLDTLDRAINVLERKLRGSALMQTTVNSADVNELVRTIGMVVDAAGFSLPDKQRLVSLAQSSSEDADASEEMGAPAAEAYQSHSKSIVEVLEDMRAKAANQLASVQKEETNAKHNFALLKQSLEDEMKADAKEMSQAKSTKAGAESTKASAEGELASTEKNLATSEKTLENMSTGCSTAAEDHDASVKSRAEELKALAAAKKAIAENAGGAGDKVYSFLQESQQESNRLINIEVVNLIRSLARKDQSTALSQLASRVSSALRFAGRNGADPFAKVKSMIKEMVDKLEKEGEEEATHKAWCDEQMGETKEKMAELKHEIEGQTAKIDKSKAKSIKLKDEVKGLQEALAELTKSQGELDSVRRAENKAFVATKLDLEQGLKGVRMALKVLKEYYGGAALVQRQAQPELEAGHSKSAGAGSGIIGMLEVIESDFGKSLATAEAEEDSASVEYEKVSMGNRLNKAAWEKDVEYKTKEYDGLDKTVIDTSSDRDSAQSELDAVLEYNKSVVGACELKPESYGDRKGRREDEVAGLKQALKILEGQAVLIQRSSSLRLRRGDHGHSTAMA